LPHCKKDGSIEGPVSEQLLLPQATAGVQA
jgi:hypothetical protein